MGDVVQFPEKEGTDDLMADIKIFGNGKVTVWISQEVDDVESTRWLKSMTTSAVGSISEMCDKIDPPEYVIDGERDEDDI